MPLPTALRPSVYVALAGAILLLALGLRLVELDKGMRLDEYNSLEVTAAADGWQKLSRYDHPPLYFMLLRVVRWFSSEIAWMRLPSIVAGLATVACVLVWLRRYGQSASLLAGLLTAANPELIHYSQEIRHYSLLVFWVVLAFALADRAVSSPEHPTLALSWVLVAAVATHLIAMFVWTAVLLYLGIRWLAERGFGWRALVLPVVLPSALLGVFAARIFWFIGRKQDHWWIEAPDPTSLTTIARFHLGIDAAHWCTSVAGSFSPWLEGLVWLGLVGAFGVLAAVLLLPPPDRRSGALLAAAFCFGLQMLAVSLWIVPVLIPRTGLPFLSILLVTLGIQVSRIGKSGWRAIVIAAAVAVASLWASWWLAFAGHQSFEPWKETAGTLASHWRAGDVAIFFPSYALGPIAFYFPELETQAAAVPVRAQLEIAELRALLAKTFEQHPALQTGARLWVVSRDDPNLAANREQFDTMMTELARRFAGEASVVDTLQGVTIARFLPHPASRQEAATSVLAPSRPPS